MFKKKLETMYEIIESIKNEMGIVEASFKIPAMYLRKIIGS